MIKLRKSDARGHANHGWLDSYHTFSFAGYFDAEHMQFRDLRVINEDWIAPAAGFPTHPHRDMEIVTYVVSGELEHRDSMGNGSIIRAGEIQRMSAGSGISHSEYNHSSEHPVHLLQIWIRTEIDGIAPGYEQKSYLTFRQPNGLTLIASRGARENSIHINQDVNIYTGNLDGARSIQYQPPGNRHTWIQLIDGEVRLGGLTMKKGDGAAIGALKNIALEADSDSEFLLFDLK